ncbi:MAG: hypothetical protein JJ969_17170 [Rhizobiaceae bacterium]|nr:hypothetical protein [Rhizobiaceae bacterium]
MSYSTIQLIHALPPSERRCFDRKEAASYVGVSPNTLDRLVRQGLLPSPIKWCGRKVWDRNALDLAIASAANTPTKGTSNEIDRILGVS